MADMIKRQYERRGLTLIFDRPKKTKYFISHDLNCFFLFCIHSQEIYSFFPLGSINKVSHINAFLLNILELTLSAVLK